MNARNKESLTRALVDLVLTLAWAWVLMLWLSYAHKDAPQIPPLGFVMCYLAVFITVGVVRLAIVGVKR